MFIKESQAQRPVNRPVFNRIGPPSPQDMLLMRVVNDMASQKRNETYRESRRGKTKTSYPPSGDGKTQFGNLGQTRKQRTTPPVNPALMQLLASMGRGKFNTPDQMQGMDFLQHGRLDASQVEDRRTPMGKLRDADAFMGDGRLERGAPPMRKNFGPPGYGMDQDLANTAPPLPVNGQGGIPPMEIMMQLLKQYAKGGGMGARRLQGGY